MKESVSHSWSIVFSAVERYEMAIAFRGSQWQDTWFDNMSLIDDSDPDARRIVTIPLKNLDELIEVLRLCVDVRPAWGIQLCVSGDFGAANVSANLCSGRGAFLKSSCVMHSSPGAVDKEIADKLNQADASIHELRQVLGMKAAF